MFQITMKSTSASFGYREQAPAGPHPAGPNPPAPPPPAPPPPAPPN